MPMIEATCRLHGDQAALRCVGRLLQCPTGLGITKGSPTAVSAGTRHPLFCFRLEQPSTSGEGGWGGGTAYQAASATG